MNILHTINTAIKAIDYPQKPAGLYEPIDYVLTMGGKRLRPVLTILGYSLYREDIERALPAGLALETYHNHTLLHDDLMDNADMRRGMPTVHKKWDANTAVLSGDTMLIMACRKMMETDTPHLRELMDLFLRTQQEICEGQQYDVNFETRTDVTIEEYIEMIRLKTSVLLACALQSGALIADAPEEDQRLLYAFGERIGLAFQLQDDFLDCYGDPAVFGKAIGGDIRCGKKTFMLISALQQASDADRATLLNSHEPADILPLYERYNIPQQAKARMQQYYDEAQDIIAQLPAPEERKQILWQYAEGLLSREK